MGFPRRLDVLDRLASKSVHYKVPKIGDYEAQRVAVSAAAIRRSTRP